MVKNPLAKAGDTGSIPGSGRYPGVGGGNPLQYSCWKISWTEEPGRLQSMESQRVGHNLETKRVIQSTSLHMETVAYIYSF